MRRGGENRIDCSQQRKSCAVKYAKKYCLAEYDRVYKIILIPSYLS